MGWGGKGKGKGKVKGSGKAWLKQEEEAGVDIEGQDEDDDDNAAPEGDDDEEWLAFQSAVLAKLVASGALTTGKLGHELGAKKKPVAAALFALVESGMVDRSDSIPPKWSPKEGIELAELVDSPVAPRFLYDESKKRPNAGKASKDSFETLKLIVRSHLSQGGNGISGGALGYKLNASKKVVNAALYACEKDGTAWTLSDPQSGVKLRWGGVPMQCDQPLPACFSYDGSAREAHEPAMKRARTTEASAGSSGDPFEDMKLVCWAAVASKGEKGCSSGQLGYEMGCDRKAITAALYACQSDGYVQNTAEDGKPRWVCLQQPPDAVPEIPDRFSYKGDKVKPAAKATAPAAGMMFNRQVAVANQAMPIANIPGLSAKQQAALARKGGGKGFVVQQGGKGNVIQQAGGPQGGLPAENPVAFINQWAQKSKKALSFPEAGQDESGAFICKCVVDGEEVGSASARNKKQAKTSAAIAALEAMGMA